MNIFEMISKLVNKVNGVEKTSNPNAEQYLFISDEETVWRQQVTECKVWYSADSNKLNLLYKERMNFGGFAQEPIETKNKRTYFWARSERELQDYKKIHTGIPRAAITTMVNCLQDVTITCDAYQQELDQILEVNNFTSILNQESRPITLTEGDGAWKPVFNKEVSDVPLIQFYEALDCDFIEKSGVLTGIVYKDYYKYQGKNYVLLEIRRVEDKNSIIEYKLYRFGKNNEVKSVPLHTIPELQDLDENGLVIPGLNMVLGVRSRYFFNPDRKTRGLSVLAGRIDIADDMDMLASIESMTEQCSGPVEYYPVDLLKRDKQGRPELPKMFGRKFIKKPVVPSADGSQDGKIDTSAPDLNFQKYSDALTAKTLLFLSGFLSPATMGIDIAKKDNAEAQREKEKVTITTRNNIKANEEQQVKQLMKMCLYLKEYMDTGAITPEKQFDISVKYSDFASPTFETMSAILTPMLSAGAISEEMFVDKLYGDSLSEQEKQNEINAIKSNKEATNMDLGALLGNEASGNMGTTEPNEDQSPEFKE